MKFLFSLIFGFAFLFSSAQQSLADSLEKFIKSYYKEDTLRVDRLNGLSWTLLSMGDYKKAMEYARVAIESAKKINYKIGISNSYNCLGAIYFYEGNYPDALNNFFAMLKIVENQLEEAKKSGNAEQIIKWKRGRAAALGNIGEVYAEKGNYEEALENFFASLEIYKEVDLYYGIANSNNNIGNVYFEQSQSSKVSFEENIKLLNEALKNHFLALKLHEKNNDVLGMATSNAYIGNDYSKLEKFSEAFKHYSKSQKLFNDIGDRHGIAGLLINKGEMQIRLKDFKNAGNDLKKALEIAKEIGNKQDIKKGYNALAALDSAQGNFRQAFKHYKMFILYSDSLKNEENEKKFLSARMNSAFNKKQAIMQAEHEKQMTITEEQKKKQQIVILFVAGGLLLVMIFSGFIFHSLRITKKQKNIIELQKNEVSRQKEIVEEHQKEIIDSINYAKRIQFALLAHDTMLKNNIPDYFVFFRPKDIVSGDFYWATQKENRFYLAVCDSTGHGVPGAFMSLLNISFLNEAINEKGIVPPNDVLNHVRLRLIENISQDGAQDGMDAVLVCFERSVSGTQKPDLSFWEAEMKITYAAANNAPVIIRNGKITLLPCDKMPVGKGEKSERFKLQALSVEKGDSIYLFTDGFADQFGGPKGKKFKYKQLEEKLLHTVNLPMKEQKNSLNKTFTEWKGNLEQVDDICVIGIRV